MGGELREGPSPDRDRLLLCHGPWRLWLDTVVVNTGEIRVAFTRARAEYLGRRALTLKVRPRGRLDRLAEALGLGARLPVGRELADAFVLRGKPRARLPSLFTGGGLGEALLDLPECRLQVMRSPRKVRRRLGSDAGIVDARIRGTPRDPSRLAAVLVVVRETLDALRRIGEADDREVPA